MLEQAARARALPGETSRHFHHAHYGIGAKIERRMKKNEPTTKSQIDHSRPRLRTLPSQLVEKGAEVYAKA